ncbi:MAG: FeoB-associated Cys-rich membrane protein [Treponema sp.]|nr:FeoB-associated Cys-rich membrane protein [Treponema sp.]
MDIQVLIVVAVVLAAAVFLVVHIVKVVRAKRPGCCEGGKTCSCSKSK